MATDPGEPSSSSPNKRRKTLLATSKVKIEEEPTHNQHEALQQQRWAADSCCMVCLSDCGKSIRGEIDCCDHYFCFICIMEWSKIESRCPACKRRFSTIRRPFMDGVSAPERVVRVPLRDQIYTCYGNSTAGPFDPFSHVQCSVCHRMTDESLLLLCDLCDSASHTYCIGLGFTVPEGDWFCHDCTVCKTERTNREMYSDGDNDNVTPNAKEHVTIFDIVRESNNPPANRKGMGNSSNPNQDSPPVAPEGNVVTNKGYGSGGRILQHVSERTTQSGARTLQRCRDVQGHIRALRENWNAFRNGSLSFSSGSSKPGSRNGLQNISAVLHDGSGEQHSLSSRNCQQSTAESALTGGSGHNRCSKEIEKAWKMMMKAKSIKSTHERTSCANQASKLPLKTGRASKDLSSAVKNQELGAKCLGSISIEKQYKSYYPKRQIGMCRSPNLEKQGETSVSSKRIVESSEGPAVTHSSGSSKSSYYGNERSSIQGDVYQSASRMLKKHVKEALSNVSNEDNRSARLMDLVGSTPGASEALNAKAKISSWSPSEGDFSEEKVRLGKECTKSNARKDDDAKCQIQSLVKLNLKLLSVDKKLGVGAFKDIARLATHTIMAACGLEHRRSDVHLFPGLVCSHTEHMQQLHKSTLMPNSCRECFCVFVKDVVDSVLREKEACVKLS